MEHNMDDPSCCSIYVHLYSQRERKTKEPVRERKTVGASARGRPWEPVRERKTMGASEQEKEPWEPVSERKTMGASEREEDYRSQ